MYCKLSIKTFYCTANIIVNDLYRLSALKSYQVFDKVYARNCEYGTIGIPGCHTTSGPSMLNNIKGWNYDDDDGILYEIVIRISLVNVFSSLSIV